MRIFPGLATVFVFCFIISDQMKAQTKSFNVLNPQVQQGGILIINIAPQWQGPQVSIAVFGKHYIPNKYGEVYIGIDKHIAPGKHIITLVEYGRGVRLSWDYEEVEVLERIFPVRGKVSGRPRNQVEAEAISKAYKSGHGSEKYMDTDFVMPLDRVIIDQDRAVGDVFSPFGGENHRGVDLITFDPRTGRYKRSVKTVNSGMVVLARRFSVEGNLIIIDHGSGIFSLYMHLSKFNVGQGEFVKTGQVIGMSGRTGKVTGPHLHFAIRVGDPFDLQKFIVVDPLVFIETVNKYLE